MTASPTPAVVITIRDGARHQALARAFAAICNEQGMDTVCNIPDYALGEHLAWTLQHVAALQARQAAFFGGALPEWKARAEPPVGQRSCTPAEREFLDRHAITPAEVQYLLTLRSLSPERWAQVDHYATMLANAERTGAPQHG